MLYGVTYSTCKEWFIYGTLACDVSHMGFEDADNLAGSNICISLMAIINM